MKDKIISVSINEPSHNKPFHMVYVTTEKRGYAIKIQAGEDIRSLGHWLSGLSKKMLK